MATPATSQFAKDFDKKAVTAQIVKDARDEGWKNQTGLWHGAAHIGYKALDTVQKIDDVASLINVPLDFFGVGLPVQAATTAAHVALGAGKGYLRSEMEKAAIVQAGGKAEDNGGLTRLAINSVKGAVPILDS